MKHVLHNHPKSEWKLNIPIHKVIVDEEFAGLFSIHWMLEEKPGHIVVNKDEFIKNGGRFDNKMFGYE